uniref:Uncharacterized protein n=1 Tax=Anopheles albimanus TaxID=7167 RepID=A0A182FZ15_ANOAL
MKRRKRDAGAGKPSISPGDVTYSCCELVWFWWPHEPQNTCRCCGVNPNFRQLRLNVENSFCIKLSPPPARHCPVFPLFSACMCDDGMRSVRNVHAVPVFVTVRIGNHFRTSCFAMRA